MEVDFVNFENIANNKILVTAGKYTNPKDEDDENNFDTFVKFYLLKSWFNVDKYERFGKKVMNYKPAKLTLNNGEDYIKYSYNDSSVEFFINNFYVKLEQRFAPECLRERLSEFIDC